MLIQSHRYNKQIMTPVFVRLSDCETTHAIVSVGILENKECYNDPCTEEFRKKQMRK